MINLDKLITKEDKFAQAKENKLREIDRERDEALNAGFEYDGIMYDSDQKSIQRISALVTFAMMDENYTTDYITKDNSIVTLGAQDITGLGQAAAQHEASLVFLARQLKDQALAATDQEELDDINWPSEEE